MRYPILRALLENENNARELNVNFMDDQTKESCIFTLVKSNDCNAKKLSYFINKCKDHNLCLNINLKNLTENMSPFGYALQSYNIEKDRLSTVLNTRGKHKGKYMFEVLLETEGINPNLAIGKPELTPLVYVLCKIKDLEVCF